MEAMSRELELITGFKHNIAEFSFSQTFLIYIENPTIRLNVVYLQCNSDWIVVARKGSD